MDIQHHIWYFDITIQQTHYISPGGGNGTYTINNQVFKWLIIYLNGMHV